MSFHENTEELVNGVCMLEFANATENWGETFNSLHEGWAIVRKSTFSPLQENEPPTLSDGQAMAT